MSATFADRTICHINLASGYRGGERQAELLLRELARRGLRQRLVVRTGSALTGRCRAVAGLEVVEAGGRAFGAAFAAQRADLLHAHEGRAFYAAAMAHRMSGAPYVLTRRVPNPQKPSLLRRSAYRGAGRLCGVSQAVADNIRVLYPDLDVTVVPDAHAALKPANDDVKAVRDRFANKWLIGHIGALDDAHKGQRVILAAAARAAVERPDWQFVLCGDGKDEAALKEEAEALDNVTFTGFIDDVAAYLASFDVFVFPSNFEALGSSLLDAMYLGLPIVASRTGGIPEFVEHDTNGILIAPGDSDALFAGVETLVDHPALRDAVSQANRAKAARYDAVAMADSYAAIYAALLASRSRRDTSPRGASR